MKTTIDNNIRVFQVVDSMNRSCFCNLDGLNEVCKDMRAGYFTIYHFWDSKPKKVSKKYLRELAEANQMQITFDY